jgi:D-alanyl-lipoteichoic acid acyltransferase DltB (MBOAT superfamily)
LDHITKVFIFILAVESMAQALCGLERLLGFDTTPIIDRAFLARTPADFWRRWNNRINVWLYWNAFVPAGGRRAPIRGVWAACLLSAVLHEIAFTIATSRFTGYQFIFFLIQAPAIILSRPLERLARTWGAIGIAIAHTATVLWMGCTSMFFLYGVDLIFAFLYAGEPWLP